MVEPGPLQTLGHALHLHDRVVELVRVLVARAVAQIAHEACGRVPQVVGDGRGVLLAHGALRSPEAPVDRVTLGRLGEIDHRLGDGELALGEADEMKRPLRGGRHGERIRIRHADVFRGEAHEAPQDVHGVFAPLEHAREPVERGVGIGSPQGLVKCGDEIVVLLTRLVVEQRLALGGLAHQPGIDPAALACQGRGGFENVQGRARVPRCLKTATRRSASSSASKLHGAQAPLGVLQGAAEKRDDVLFLQSFQHEHARAGEQGRDDLEGRVFRRRADEGEHAVFDVGQEAVLLGLVEAVDLVDEQNRADAPALHALRLVHGGAQFLHPVEHRAQRDEVRVRPVRDDARERRLARAGRSPEDKRAQGVFLHGAPQHAARADEVILAQDLIERPGAHAFGQGRRRIDPGFLRSARAAVFFWLIEQASLQGALLFHGNDPL